MNTFTHFLWAMALGGVSAVSLPLGSLVGLKYAFGRRYLSAFAAFGAGALIAALSVELVAPTSLALTASEGTDHARANFFALIVGGVCGGALFVALDAVVNHQGGHVRKRSTMLARSAKHRRAEVRKRLQAVLEVRPFNALPSELTETLASLLALKDFRAGEELPVADADHATAYMVLDGQLSIAMDGKLIERADSGTFVGLLICFVPELAKVPTLKAETDVRCLALRREDMDHLRTLSPAFDQACREVASERMGKLEKHLVMRLSEAVQWARSAADALRRGQEAPAFAIRQASVEHTGSPLAVWLGILLDGIPESLVIGAGLYVMLTTHSAVETLRFAQVIPYTLIAGLFLSNFPEALSSSANMLSVGWKRRLIFLMWFALMVITAIGAGLGFLLAAVLSETWLVFAEGVAAGAMLTMIAAAMIPEAAEHGRPSEVGLSTLGGFLAAVMFKLLE